MSRLEFGDRGEDCFARDVGERRDRTVGPLRDGCRVDRNLMEWPARTMLDVRLY
ncbi:hypothetical protein [Actinoallomurus sp. NPDC050550]|uniref:hypothetical protein n=1 Tax=Actinoallomurus sp. NPDC050550 TaxID=3154937 RepID=UPI00340E2E20